MHSGTKLLLTVVMATAALTFVPYAVKAEDTGNGMMNNTGQEAKEVAIHGFCPVCVINGMKVKGKDTITAEFNGKIYYFAGEDQKKMFLADPEKYVTDLDAKFNALKDDGMMKKDENSIEGSH